MNDFLETCVVKVETKIYFDDDEGKSPEEKSDIKVILTNGQINGFKFFDAKTGEFLSKETAETMAFGLARNQKAFNMYAYVEEIPIEIRFSYNGKIQIKSMKKNVFKRLHFEESKKTADLSFYIKCMLKLCEHYMIEGLEAEIEKSTNLKL